MLITAVILIVLSILLSLSSVQTRLARLVTQSINSKFDTSILIERVDLSSLRNIELKNILIKDHHQDSLIYVNNLTASILNLRNILESDLNLGDVEIDKGILLIRTYKGEEINNLTIFYNHYHGVTLENTGKPISFVFTQSNSERLTKCRKNVEH